MFIIFTFLFLSYFAGNNKFPHNFWFVPVGTIGIGIAVLYHVYLNDKIKKEKRNGKNKR
jgi:1,4-dihydroxy-2-naphthoate octaprenyltransferase